MKTSELTGAALDWAVAMCEGVTLDYGLTDDERYSTNWAQGGPIIEREKITLDLTDVEYDEESDTAIPLDTPVWWASKGEVCGRGPTPLIAAMRCYVASKLGDNIDVPKELK